VDALTACDRILSTPIPLSYTRHTSRFLLIWLLLLPFSLWRLCGWSMVPLTALIAFVLFGIEEIGVQVRVRVLAAARCLLPWAARLRLVVRVLVAAAGAAYVLLAPGRLLAARPVPGLQPRAAAAAPGAAARCGCALGSLA
jgi:hypothetical protein